MRLKTTIATTFGAAPRSYAAATFGAAAYAPSAAFSLASNSS